MRSEDKESDLFYFWFDIWLNRNGDRGLWFGYLRLAISPFQEEVERYRHNATRRNPTVENDLHPIGELVIEAGREDRDQAYAQAEGDDQDIAVVLKLDLRECFDTAGCHSAK